MSSFAYGVSTARRVATPRSGGAADAPDGAAGDAKGTIVGALAAVVPAEALLVYSGVLLALVAETSKGRDDELQTTVTDPELFQWGVVVLAGLAAALFVLGRIRGGKATLWDIPRALIPAAAFVCWAAVQQPSAIELWIEDVSASVVQFSAIVAGVLLTAAAAALGAKADAQ